MLRVNDITRLYLGIQGENNQKTIEIDVSYWLETYPNATITIWHKRNGDTTPEPVPGVLDRTNKILRWTPTTTDTYVAGEGEGEIRLTENNVIKKSVSFITGVAPSITGVGSLTGSGWQDYLAATEAAKNAAATSATNAATSESNAAGSATAAASSATAAAGSATNAASSATAAGNSATAAGNSANAAAGSATNAANSATAAGNSASAAASSASSANSSKTAAATSATNAANSATSAGSSATAASGSATNAAASATAAAGSASNAANSATAAGNSATAAANSATAASGSASSAAQSAAAAAASAAQTTAEVVRAWLNEHVDPDTGYVIDDSLTIQGAAADAKKVGDAVSDLNSAINSLGNNGIYPFEVFNGFLKQDGTVNTRSDYRSGKITVSVTPGDVFTYKGDGGGNAVSVLFYDASDNIVSYLKYSASAYHEITVPNGVSKAIFASTVASTDSSNLVFELYKNGTVYDGIKKNADKVPGMQTSISNNTTAIGTLRTDMENVDEKIRGEVKDITGDIAISLIRGKAIKTANNPLTMSDGVPVMETAGAAECAYVECSPGDLFTINGASTLGNYRLWEFADISGNRISFALSNATATGLVLEAPNNAKWLILNNTDFGKTSYKGKTVSQRFFETNTVISDNSSKASQLFSGLVNTVISGTGAVEITNYQLVSGLGLQQTNVVANANRKCLIAPIVPNTMLLFEKIQTQNCKIGLTAEYPVVGTTVDIFANWNATTNTKIYQSTGTNEKYVIIEYYSEYDESASAIEESIKLYYASESFGKHSQFIHADDKMINLLKYRPLGILQKPYIAISCDDGEEPLATYTLPQAKVWKQTYGINIPITMGLYDLSDVLLNSSYKNLVIEMCEDYGCAIGTHGGSAFTSQTVFPTRDKLISFIDKQEKFIFDETGIEPTSIIYPTGNYNDMVKTLTGAYHGICFNVADTKNEYAYRDTAARSIYNGPKSNLYALNRFSIHSSEMDETAIKDIIDYAYDHCYLICPYFHDINLTTGENAQRNKDRLNYLVQYGISKGIDFVNFTDIVNLL